MPNTVRFHRVLLAAAEKVYKAFIDPDAMAKWLPPNGFTGKVHEMDARVGGGYRMSFTNFSTDKSHSFRGRFVELTPPARIVETINFDTVDPAFAGEMTMIVTLAEQAGGKLAEIRDRPAAIPDQRHSDRQWSRLVYVQCADLVDAFERLFGRRSFAGFATAPATRFALERQYSPDTVT